MDRPIFHLSFPVLDLDAAKTFYCDVLGATVGRENTNWADIVLFGHQLTLHNRPSEVLGPDQRGVRHFGAILPWQEWVALGEQFENRGCTFLRPPTISCTGTEEEYGKMLLCDPSDNVIEIKAYRHGAVIVGAVAPAILGGMASSSGPRVAGRIHSSARSHGGVSARVMTDPDLIFRSATRDDLPAIVGLLADDPLGAQRENYVLPLPGCYEAAFAAIDQDPHNELIVVDAPDHPVAGVLQLTVVPHITYRGGWRAQIEGVRVASSLRSSGIGEQLFQWAIQRAKAKGCHLVQLTSDKARPDAIRFYERLGFVASHEGLKLHLDA